LPTFAICLAYVSDYAAALQWSFFDKAFGITWSLSMEEQFYMLWPFALWLGGRRSLMLCLLLIAAVICWRAAVVCSGAPWQRLYFAFDTRFDSILIGCAAALLRRHADSANSLALLRRAPWAAGFAVAASAATLPYLGVSRGVIAWCIRLPFHNALVAMFVVTLVEAPKSAIARVLAMRVPAFLGRLSYGMYLWHQFAFLEVDSIALSFRRSHTATTSLAAQLPTEGAKLVLTVAMAGLSYFAVEKPFLRLKRRLHGSALALTANDIGGAPQAESR
jgi:peptidoglycan/LPS O-acetylase OafA/YrhL